MGADPPVCEEVVMFGTVGSIAVILYVLFVLAIAVLVVLAIVALVLSIRLLRIRIAQAQGPRPLDGIDDPQRWEGGEGPDDGIAP
jgi:hypothetical protein